MKIGGVNAAGVTFGCFSNTTNTATMKNRE
jgi:hypothetical protein